MDALIKLRIGSRWQSAVSEAEVIVVKAPADPVDLRCGGQPMLPPGETAPSSSPAVGETLAGKRYTHEASGLLLLCLKGGGGELSVGDELMEIQATRALPSSD